MWLDTALIIIYYLLLYFWEVWSICNECQLEMHHYCTKDLSVIVVAVGQRGVLQGAGRDSNLERRQACALTTELGLIVT